MLWVRSNRNGAPFPRITPHVEVLAHPTQQVIGQYTDEYMPGGNHFFFELRGRKQAVDREHRHHSAVEGHDVGDRQL